MSIKFSKFVQTCYKLFFKSQSLTLFKIQYTQARSVGKGGARTQNCEGGPKPWGFLDPNIWRLRTYVNLQL